MSTHYLTMTDAEFKAHWDDRYAQFARVNRRTWLYGLPLLLSVVAVIGALSVTASLPAWACVAVGGVGGVAVGKFARALAWRREGGKPSYLR